MVPLYNPQADEKISVAKVQKDIKVGMSSAEVIEVLGSPNIISTDEQKRETWVYDKVSTQSAYQNSEGGIWLCLTLNLQDNISLKSWVLRWNP